MRFTPTTIIMRSNQDHCDVKLSVLNRRDFEATDDDGAKVAMSPNPDAYSPSALVLAGLAGCTGMDAASIMNKKKLAVDKYSVEVHGEQREAHPRFFTSITVEHIIDRLLAAVPERSEQDYARTAVKA